MRSRLLRTSIGLGLATTLAISLLALVAPDPTVIHTSERDSEPSRGEGPGFVALVYWTSPFSSRWQSLAARERFCFILQTEDHPVEWKKEPPESLAPDWSRSTLFPWKSGTSWPPPGDEQFCNVIATGWPCRIFWCKLDPPSSSVSIHSGGLQLPRGPRGYPTAIPLRLLSRGLIVNTLLFSTLWYLILVTPSAWRRHRRRAQNACTSCGYNLDGLRQGTPCPECGG